MKRKHKSAESRTAEAGAPLLTDGSATWIDVREPTPSSSPSSSMATTEAQMDEFCILHPMLSNEALNTETLRTVCMAHGRVDVTPPSLPVVSKAYEDAYLRPPRNDLGERECVAGKRCMCVMLAKARYGNSTKRGFVGVEFMLPEDRDLWRSGKGRPERHGKCLLCIRYLTTYLYVRSMSDPGFLEVLRSGRLLTQTHTVSTCELTSEGKVLADGLSLPTHSSVANTVDGYLPSALIPVEADFVNTGVGRETSLSSLAWQPFVRFQSNHYKYIWCDSIGEQRIVQVGVSCDHFSTKEMAMQEHLNWDPPRDEASRAAEESPKA